MDYLILMFTTAFHRRTVECYKSKKSSLGSSFQISKSRVNDSSAVDEYLSCIRRRLFIIPKRFRLSSNQALCRPRNYVNTICIQDCQHSLSTMQLTTIILINKSRIINIATIFNGSTNWLITIMYLNWFKFWRIHRRGLRLSLENIVETRCNAFRSKRRYNFISSVTSLKLSI